MGNRLHVAEKYELKFAPKAEFNHLSTQILEIWALLGIDMPDYPCCLEDGLEVHKKDFSKAIQILKNLEDHTDVVNTERVLSILNTIGMSPEEFAKELKEYYSLADPNNEYMYFAYF